MFHLVVLGAKLKLNRFSTRIDQRPILRRQIREFEGHAIYEMICCHSRAHYNLIQVVIGNVDGCILKATVRCATRSDFSAEMPTSAFLSRLQKMDHATGRVQKDTSAGST